MIKNKFHRGILLIISGLYLSFFLIYLILEIEDPMPLSLRIFMVLLGFSLYFLSFKIIWVKNRLDKISHMIVFFSILQLIYYSYIFDFNLIISGLIFIAIIIMNLMFESSHFNILINIFIGILIILSLFLKNKEAVFSVFFFASYISISLLSLYLKRYLTKNKEKLENLANQAPGALYQYQLFSDGSSCFPYASKGMFEIHKVRPMEIINDGSKVFERIHPEDYKKVIDSIQISAKNLETWHDEYRVILPEKEERWIKGNAKPEKLKDGSILWHGNIRDITREKNYNSK